MPILAHNEKAGSTWGSGGAAYDKISDSISDAISHTVNRVWPVVGERYLDVATGTGWTARQIAKRGATVTGIDFGAGVISAAKQLAPEIEFQVGDAEALEFGDAAFDAVTSTFGVMFVARPEVAAAELARVVRPGGRLALATWRPDSTIFDLFKTMKPYMPPPPSTPPPSPFAWGTEDRLTELLGGAFDLAFESGTSMLRMPSGEAVWDVFVGGYGPTKTLANSLDPERAAGLKRDFIAMHEQYRAPNGLAMPREYVVTLGVRR